MTNGYVKIATILMVLVCCFLAASIANSMSGNPAQFDCSQQPDNGAFRHDLCAIGIEPYIPPQSQLPHPVSFSHQPEGANLVMTLKFNGWNARPNHCERPDLGGAQSSVGTFQIDVCSSHYPDVAFYNQAKGWGVNYFTPNHQWRVGLSLSKGYEIGGDKIDSKAGIHCNGTSYGATRCIAASMNLEDWFYRSLITVVNAQVPTTLPHRIKDPTVQMAWGDYDTSQVNFRWLAAFNAVGHIYYRLNGSPADNAVDFDLEFFRICDEYQVACFGTWHDAKDENGNPPHSLSEPGLNLPFGRLYTEGHDGVRLDKPLVAFTESTANHWGARGHYNLGLAAKFATVSTESITVSLRYKRTTGIGLGVPDQPITAKSKVTIRRTGNQFPIKVGDNFNWVFGSQSGTATSTEGGEVTIGPLDYISSQIFTKLLITPRPQGYPLVYTRQPRVEERFANWQHWYDGGLPDRFTEADVVIDDLNGNVEVIHKCTTSPIVCAAHDARVSPDGKRIIFTVAYGAGPDSLYSVRTWGDNLITPKMEFQAVRYETWLYQEGRSRMVDGDSRMSDWGSDDSVVFASSRANTYAPWIMANPPGPVYKRQLNIFKADLGNGFESVRNLTPHGHAMSPMVTTDGDICYSIWNGFGDKAVTHTAANMWPIECMDGNGTNHHMEINAHGSSPIKTVAHLTGIVDTTRQGEGSTAFRLTRAPSEIKPGLMATGNYYRSNHQGPMGMSLAYRRMAVEGYSKASAIPEIVSTSIALGSGRYIPKIYSLCPYGNDADNDVRFHVNGKAMGKCGYAAASIIGEFLFTHLRGSGYEGTMPNMSTREAMGGEPTSKREIRVALVPVVTDPFDEKQSVVVACKDDKWNCFDARWVAPYRELLGQDSPDPPPAPVIGTYTTLQIVDAKAGELYPLQGPDVTPQDKISFQGNADADALEVMAGIQITLVEPWRAEPTRYGFASSEVLQTFWLEDDGSVEIKFPCGTPYQLRGVDSDSEVVATDSTLHPAVCGEVTTCHGCHDGHSEERRVELGASAEERFKHTIAAEGSE